MTTSSRRRVSAAVAWLSAGLGYLTLEGIAAAAFRPHYSYANNLISDLGIPSGNSPLAWLMNIAFCLQGTLFLVGAVLTVRAVEARKAGLFVTLAAANAVGNLLIAAFHSGPASQVERNRVGARHRGGVGDRGRERGHPRGIEDRRRLASQGIGRTRSVRPAQLRAVRHRAEGIQQSAAWDIGAMQRLFDHRVATVHGGLATQPAAHSLALSSSSSLKSLNSPGINHANACRV